MYIYPKYWGKQAWTNSVDPDQMPQNVASDHGLHFLPPTLLNTSVDYKVELSIFLY